MIKEQTLALRQLIFDNCIEWNPETNRYTFQWSGESYLLGYEVPEELLDRIDEHYAPHHLQRIMDNYFKERNQESYQRFLNDIGEATSETK